ncbi:hypothetical protein GCM10011348_33040 [Marinobacterium nitratireducens]|uniref:Methionyl-tRNA formyltransferase-like C-terminal domain-containing protein n=1 Tax=Marinobacterium nitratireducens TaxID=518897 RepID=A0A917ZKN8_9GAMM|nr:methionyl-tRNA formyltransferase [Marinobacterium nitratireducens]GGO85151.1 hypothetical protein GCM10011348_33040 [Marinobacterium nitratireducens]
MNTYNQRQNTADTYIVASCKQWHQAGYSQLKNEISGNWFWVSNPEELVGVLTYAQPRYIFFIHWSWLLPESIFSRYECVCFHMTDVPYGRGGSPLQNLILSGHVETTLSALKMTNDIDAGPVYTKRLLSLKGKAQNIYEKAGFLSFEIIRWLIEKNPVPIEQSGKVTYFKRRKPEDSRVPEGCNQKELYDFIRMLDADGYPHAFIEYGNKRLELTDAVFEDGGLTARVTIHPKDTAQ